MYLKGATVSEVLLLTSLYRYYKGSSVGIQEKPHMQHNYLAKQIITRFLLPNSVVSCVCYGLPACSLAQI